jgi:hypothetical protein
MKEKLGSLLEFLSKIGISKMDKLSKEVYINTIIDINARLLGLKTDVNLNNQFELLIPLKVDKRKNNNNLTPDVKQAIIDIFKFKKGEISISYLKNNNNKPYVTLIEGNNELSATSNLLKDIKSDDIDTQIYKVFNKLLLKKGKDFKTTHFDLSNTTINDLNNTFRKDVIDFYLENILTEDKNNPLEFNDILTIKISKYDNFSEFVKSLKFSDSDIKYYTERLSKSKMTINNILDKVYSNADLHKGLNRLNKTIPKLMLLISEYNKGINDVKNVFSTINLDNVSYEINEFEKLLLNVFANLDKPIITNPLKKSETIRDSDDFENTVLNNFHTQLARTITLGSTLTLLQELRAIGYQIPNLSGSGFNNLRELLNHLDRQTEMLEDILSAYPQYNTRLVTFSPYNDFVGHVNSLIRNPGLIPPAFRSSINRLPDVLFDRQESALIFSEQYDEMMDEGNSDFDEDDLVFQDDVHEEVARPSINALDELSAQISREIRERIVTGNLRSSTVYSSDLPGYTWSPSNSVGTIYSPPPTDFVEEREVMQQGPTEDSAGPSGF